jgi:hypothetical protein
MEKEKRKGRPRRWFIVGGMIFAVLLFVCSYLAWSTTRKISLSYFSRFNTTDEVVEFLYQNLEINVTTKDEVDTFMDEYINAHAFNGCRDTLLEYVVDPRENSPRPDNAETGLFCDVPTWGSLAGTQGYTLYFDFDVDEILIYIEAHPYCMCL